MGQPVQRRTREPLAAEHLGPLPERQIGEEDAVAFMGRADHVEEQFRPQLAGRHIPIFDTSKC
jgi:hypothetical protein